MQCKNTISYFIKQGVSQNTSTHLKLGTDYTDFTDKVM